MISKGSIGVRVNAWVRVMG